MDIYNKTLKEVLKKFRRIFGRSIKLEDVTLELNSKISSPAETVDNIIKINPELIGEYSLKRLIAHELAHVYLKTLDMRDLVEELEGEYKGKNVRLVVPKSEESILAFYQHNIEPKGLFEEILKNGAILFTREGRRLFGKIGDDPLSENAIKILTVIDLLLQAVTSLGYERNTTSEILSEYIACCLYPEESLEDNLRSIRRKKKIDIVYKITKTWHLIGIAVCRLEGKKYLYNLQEIYHYILGNSGKISGEIKKILKKRGLLEGFY